jgi:hypothetical protein
MIKIDEKIVGYAVTQAGAEAKADKPEYKREGGGGDRAEVIRMHEKLERPEMLVGHYLEPRYGTRKTQAIRDFHQLEKPGSLSVDRCVNAHHFCRVSQGW